MSARATLLGAILLALSACAQNRVVLLDNGGGAVTIRNDAGTGRLDRPGAALAIASPGSHARPIAVSPHDIDTVWGAAIAALPPVPVRIVLYCDFDATALTPSSRAMLPDIVALIRQRPAPEVAITGYSDRSGSAAYNYRLGLRRARALRAAIRVSGVKPVSITIRSEGAADPLVRGADPYQPRNRRVELTIR
jgi:peptidoglycan-associated lipoprotein